MTDALPISFLYSSPAALRASYTFWYGGPTSACAFLFGSGKLFRADGNGLAGRGAQQRCTVCNRPVLTSDIEIRIEAH